MGKSVFQHADFLNGARTLIREHGPNAVTLDSLTRMLGAPKGSFYHRFESRDALMGQLWLSAVRSYQEGFVAAIEAGNGLAAALHTPSWSRANLTDACLLLLYSRHDFVEGDWPADLKRGVDEQKRQVEKCMELFARRQFGRAGTTQIKCATFVLLEAPIAAVKEYLRRREPPAAVVDKLITRTYDAIVTPAE